MSLSHIWCVRETRGDACGNEDYYGEPEYYRGRVIDLLHRFRYDLDRVSAYAMAGQDIPTERSIPHPTRGYGTWVDNPRFNREEIPHALWFKVGGFSGHEFEVINIQLA